MIVCKSCGLHNRENDAFCRSCGAFLEWSGEKLAPAAEDLHWPELLRQAREICRLHWAKRGHDDIDAKETETVRNGQRLIFIRVSYVDDNFTEHALVGVHDGALDVQIVGKFATLFAEHHDVRSNPDLIYRGAPPSRHTQAVADDLRIRLRSFDSYQRALWNHARYLENQNDELTKNILYPLDHHVDKRWALLGQQPGEADAAAQIRRWLDTDGPRFVLVLGDFGTGKTFLIRVLARDLAHHPDLVPVLVTMRDLEKRRTLDELIGLHMTRNRPEDAFHAPSFRYLLREGRIVLLFDGFDELAQRPTYDRVKEHFDTLRQAADGSAKIVVTSRHQHFATDSDVLNELGLDARGMPGARIIRLFPLNEDQQRDLVEQSIDSSEATAFLRDLGSVPNLPELATNPRMLTFMMARRDSLARLAGSGSSIGPMTAGRLYEILLTDWLEHEQSRQTAPGAATPLTVAQRCAALRQLAVLLWRSGRASVPLAELGELAEGITDLAAWQVQTGEATHAVGSGTVLVRSEGDQFAFIHQSVLEWFVADAVRTAFAGPSGGVGALLAEHALSVVMANFLCDLAGDRPLDWAQEVVGRSADLGPKAKANAMLILQCAVSRRAETRFVVTDLSGQDLRGRDLSGADLTGADLSRAELDGAVLPRTLARADLSGARLTGARLDKADLTGADLSGADLRGARLLGADLTGADLRDANLDRSILLGATIEPGTLANASTYGAALPDATPMPQHAGSSGTTAAVTWGNGDLLATGHTDGTVRISDTTSGLPLRVLTAHVSAVLAMAVVPNGAWLATAGRDDTVRIWDPTTGTQLRTLTGHNTKVVALAADPNGTWLASADGYSTVRIWDPTTGTQLHMFRDDVDALAAGPEGAWLATSGVRGTVRLRDPRTGRHLRTLTSHKGGVSVLAVDPNGAWLASADVDNTVRIWDLTTGAHLHTLTGHTSWVRALATHPDGRWLASAGDDHTVRMWDPFTGAHLHTLTGHISKVVALAAHPNGSWLSSVSQGGTARFWDPTTGTHLRTQEAPFVHVQAIALDPRQGWLSATDRDGDTGIWNPTDGRRLSTLHHHTYTKVASPDGTWLATGGFDGTVRIWDPTTGGPLQKLDGHNAPVFALAAHPSGKWLASVANDGTTRIWNPITGTHIRMLTGKTYALAVGANGAWLATSHNDGTVQLWDPTTGRRLRTHRLQLRATIWLTATNPDGTWLATTGGDTNVRIWDLRVRSSRWRRQPPTHVLTGHTGTVQTMVTASSGALLATAGSDHTIRVWDPVTGTCLHTCVGHLSPVQSLATDPAGTVLASAGTDGTIRLWDPATGTLLTTLVGDKGGSAMYRPDGSYVVHGSPSGVWWTAGLCRFEPEEIDEIAAYATGLHRMSP